MKLSFKDYSDILKLRFLSSKIGVSEYCFYGLNDNQKYDYKAKMEFVGWRLSTILDQKLNDDSWRVFANDKLVFYSMMEANGLRYPKVKAVFDKKNRFLNDSYQLQSIENARKYSVEKFASDLLPVVDSLEQGIETSANATDISTLREGMEMTTKMLISTLEKQVLIQVHPHGEKFNPEYHEAMAMLESPDIAEDHVINVFQKGYQLNGRLVRPARVVVSRGQGDAPSIDEQA